MDRLRQPLLGGMGNPVIHVICGYELIALHSPLPSISELFKIIRKSHPKLALAIFGFWMAVLTHHLMFELDEIIAREAILE